MFRRSLPRLLHDDHLTTMSLLDRIDAVVLARRTPPAVDDAEFAAVARRIETTFADEVERHFGFEEDALFPFLTERGEADIGMVLSEEHAIIREAGADIAGALAAYRATPDAAAWTRLRRLCGEMAERMANHIQKEEMALLPLIDEWLDDGSDSDLVARLLA